MNNRIGKLLHVKDVTASKFAEMIGVQPSNISHILSGRNKPSLDFIVKVAETYPDISLEWLIFGKGNMYKSENEEVANVDTSELSTIEQKEESIFEKKSSPQYHGSLFDELTNDENQINEENIIHNQKESISEAEIIAPNDNESIDIPDDSETKSIQTEIISENKISDTELNTEIQLETIEEPIPKEVSKIEKTETTLQKIILVYSDYTFEELENRKK